MPRATCPGAIRLWHVRLLRAPLINVRRSYMMAFTRSRKCCVPVFNLALNASATLKNNRVKYLATAAVYLRAPVFIRRIQIKPFFFCSHVHLYMIGSTLHTEVGTDPIFQL